MLQENRKECGVKRSGERGRRGGGPLFSDVAAGMKRITPGPRGPPRAEEDPQRYFGFKKKRDYSEFLICVCGDGGEKHRHMDAAPPGGREVCVSGFSFLIRV